MMEIVYKFEHRIKGHDALLEETRDELLAAGFDVADNGREITHSNLRLNGSNDVGSRLIRFSPDIAVMWRGHTFYIDPKASEFIEDQPYDHYKWMSKIGINVYVLSKNGICGKRFTHIDELELLPAFHDKWPINARGWIAPREHPEWEYLKWHWVNNKPFPGSGTPYRKMNFSKMSKWSTMLLNFDLQSREW